ncbi:MAG: hypothetical protein GEV07_10145 [Streptosporangiales bacterium]|nr:hypothetical protein [Streptosporangiales bacterium]
MSALLSSSVLIGAGLVAVAPAASASPATQLVNEQPSSDTPNIKDGTTYDITEVGDKVVVGGSFTEAASRGSSQRQPRNMLLAFDPDTGKLDPDFTPDVDGKAVRAVLPGPTDDTVFVAGTFTSINGTARRHLALLDTDTGEVVPGFDPPSISHTVKTLRKANGHLLAGGNFRTVGGTNRHGLASFDPESGALDDYLAVALDGHHNWSEGSPGAKGSVGAKAIDVQPNGDSLAVIGNFTSADGQARDQIARIDLGATAATVDEDWSTSAFETSCNANSFDSYVRDVDHSPDGSYLVVATTGGWGGEGEICDTATRFETDATGDVAPTWVEYTGADTLRSVAVSARSVYVGGHQRWQNNSPDARGVAGPGAVPRPGIAALDPRNGVPLEWNGARHPRGVGADVLRLTDSGLYVGQDTNYTGNREHYRGRVAFFPFAGGATVADENTGSLPGDVYLAGADGEPIARHVDGTTVGDDQPVDGGGTWADVRGAFMVNDTLYYGYRDDLLRKRTFDGDSFGEAKTVDPYSDPKWSDVQTGSGQTYRGTPPGFYGELSAVTGMLYTDGRLYYTTSGSSRLYWRSFNPRSGVVNGTAHVASEMDRWSIAGGMFLDGDTLYVTNRDNGNLYKTTWSDGRPEGTLTTVSGPAVDGKSWATGTTFLLGN